MLYQSAHVLHLQGTGCRFVAVEKNLFQGIIKVRLHLVLFSILAAGCAPASTSATATPPAAPDRVIAVDDRIGQSIRSPLDGSATRISLAATADKVFDAVTSTYAMLRVPITYADKGLGEQGNKKFVVSRSFNGQPVSTYLNCGDDPFGGPNADANPVQVSIVSRARASGGTSTVLETIVSGVTSKSGGNSGQIYCASTGTLEQRIADMVASRIPREQ